MAKRTPFGKVCKGGSEVLGWSSQARLWIHHRQKAAAAAATARQIPASIR
ncbi:hypothetical protein M2163_000094 [Streptomyces sp. SAI-135]|nr:hypothetical protein [Streptomyces sp. SAI-090]MDH6555023.1 hypothetical protein [Streptomyces sp. SAI-041]MDH6574289.1 hypothetical protein [Streptomyces sp. SAI-117]MDH6580979.1 hypothetical protein [Streptomyces sp. SAI-133]MDH6612986.1 hypothetical protein [Streptomyces sp. SAI-135]